MEVASLLVDHDAVPRSERLHIEVGVVRVLGLGARRRIERPDVGRVVALGHVEDFAVQPHRGQVAFAFPGWGEAFVGFSRYQADRLRLPAAVVAPLGVPEAEFLIGEPGAVGVEFTFVGLGGEFGWEAA